MIHYLCRDGQQDTIAPFLYGAGAVLRNVVRITPYEEILADGSLAAGHLIFTDLDRLSRSGLKATQIIADRMRDAVPGIRILNEPKHALLRYALLKALWDDGLNPFRAVRPDGALPPLRYPVFVRRESGAYGPESGLLYSEADVQDWLAARRARDRTPDDLLVVEYCAAPAADGYFRKFGTFRVGAHILPQHIQVSDRWVVKQETSFVTPALVVEEMNHIQRNPHATELRTIFDRAGIEFGRIDYSFVDGRLVVYEINTNPMFPHGSGRNGRQQLRHLVGTRLANALREVDTPLPSNRIVRLVPSARLRHVHPEPAPPHHIWQITGRSALLDRMVALYEKRIPEGLRRKLPGVLKSFAIHRLDRAFVKRVRLGVPPH